MEVESRLLQETEQEGLTIARPVALRCPGDRGACIQPVLGPPSVASLPEETTRTFFAVQLEKPGLFWLFGFILIIECILTWAGW